MKQYTKLLFIIAAVLAMFSCKEKEFGCISTDVTDFVFDHKASEQSRVVDGGYDLRASSDQSWCAATLSGDGEYSLSVRVLANTDREARYANVTLSAAGCGNVTLKVVQGGLDDSKEPYLVADRTKIETKDVAHILFVTVSSNRDDVQIVSHPDWCVPELLADKETENLRLDFSANTSDKNRTGEVVLGATGCEDLVVNVVQSRLLSKECDLLTFGLKASGNSLEKDIDFGFDKEERTLKAMYLKWIDKSEPAMLVPTFTMTGEKAMVGGKEVVSGKTAISFADDFDFTVVAENGDTRTWRVSLNCPQINTELPVLKFTPDGGDIYSKDYEVPTAIELYSPLTKEGWWSTSGGAEKVLMRGRGNSTWNWPKKPYRIKFPVGFMPVGLNHDKAKKWVLLAHDIDKSLLRNALGFELSRVMFNPAEGRHDPKACLFTPCTQFINVYKNNEYHGVYQMTDQITKDKGRMDVEKLDAQSPSGDISGGYIVECYQHNNEKGTWTSLKGMNWVAKYPDYDDCTPEQRDYIRDFINKAETALDSYYFTDPTNGWRKWIDEKTLVDFFIVKELTGDMDGFTSLYVYKRRGVDKLFFGPVWDMDKGWRNDERDHYDGTELMMKAGFGMSGSHNRGRQDWFDRLWQDRTFRTAVNDRWKQKKEELVACINKYLDEQPVKMYKAVRANFGVTEERHDWSGFAYKWANKAPWPWNCQADGDACLPKENYEAEIQYIRDVTEERVKVLDLKFAQ